VFLACLLLWLAALLVPWPGVARAYSHLFCVGGNLLFGSFGPGGEVRFKPPTAIEPAQRCGITLINRPAGKGADETIDTRFRGYAPTAVLAALVLATPIPWRRRVRALFWGLLLVQGFVAVRVALTLIGLFSNNDDLAIFHLSLFWKGAVNLSLAALVAAPPSVFVVPMLLWVLVAFRRGDWEAWTGRKPPRPGLPEGGQRRPRQE